MGEKLIERIRWWEDYTARNEGEMDNNPSPGNKRGGLTTILEKSLGAVAKGGTAPLSGVYKFAEPITTPGFTYMDSPGYDPCSVTGQIASGATMIVFTTGRGSVSGYKPSSLHQAGHQFRDVCPDERGHGHQLRRHPRRGEHRGERR